MVIQTLGPSFANAVIAMLVFSYLRVRDNERYLSLWAVAWMLWAVRYGIGIVSDSVQLIPGDPVLPALALGRSIFILWGSYSLARSRVPWYWVAIFMLNGAAIGMEAYFGRPTPFTGPPGALHYGVFGAALVWSGALLIRTRSLPSTESWIAGVALVTLGTLQFTYPWLAVMPAWYEPIAYVLVMMTQAAIPLGILLAYLRKTAEDLRVVNERLAAALTEALAQHIPICGHCKAVADGEGWVAVESYVAARTEASFSHGICPACEEEHFSEEAMDAAVAQLRGSYATRTA